MAISGGDRRFLLAHCAHVSRRLASSARLRWSHHGGCRAPRRWSKASGERSPGRRHRRRRRSAKIDSDEPCQEYRCLGHRRCMANIFLSAACLQVLRGSQHRRNRKQIGDRGATSAADRTKGRRWRSREFQQLQSKSLIPMPSRRQYFDVINRSEMTTPGRANAIERRFGAFENRALDAVTGGSKTPPRIEGWRLPLVAGGVEIRSRHGNQRWCLD